MESCRGHWREAQEARTNWYKQLQHQLPETDCRVPGERQGAHASQGESSACKDSETSKSTARPGSARPQGSEGGGGMTRAQSQSGVDCRGGGDRCPRHVPAPSTPARQTLSLLILPHKPLSVLLAARQTWADADTDILTQHTGVSSESWIQARKFTRLLKRFCLTR